MRSIRFLFYVVGITCLLASCTNDEDGSLNQIEEGIFVNGSPSIIFSYNIHDIENNTTISWLIDNEGVVRKLTQAPDEIYHDASIDFRDLIDMKSESINTTTFVDERKLLSNYNKLNKVTSLYKQAIGPKNVITIYGYYFRTIMEGSTCSCSNASASLTDRFEYSLLYKKDGDDIRTVSDGEDIVAWIESLNLENL